MSFLLGNGLVRSGGSGQSYKIVSSDDKSESEIYLSQFNLYLDFGIFSINDLGIIIPCFMLSKLFLWSLTLTSIWQVGFPDAIGDDSSAACNEGSLDLLRLLISLLGCDGFLMFHT